MSNQKEQSLGKIKKQQKPFIMSPTHICNDNRISSVAYKLWNVIESKPDDWEFFWWQILKSFKEGRNKVKKSFKELEKFGFAKKQRRKNGNLYSGMDIEIYYDPHLPLTQENNGSARETYFGSHGNGSTEIGSSQSRSSENRSTYKKGSKQDGVKKIYSLSVIKKLWKKIGERKKYNFEIDSEKFHEWVSSQTLTNSLESVLISWSEKKKNQIEKKPEPKILTLQEKKKLQEQEKRKEIFKKVQQVIENFSANKVEEGRDIFKQYFSQMKIKDEKTIFIKDKRALKYQDILKKINIKIEVKSA
jgi:hypothetical protein